MANTWASDADVTTLTGVTVPSATTYSAQQMIEALVKRVWRDSDADTSAYYWLQRAVAWQAVYLNAHPEVLTDYGVQSLSQDGFSVTFNISQIPRTARIYSPVALKMLDNLFRGANTSIRMNSAFQKNSVGKVRWRRIAW